MKYNIDKNETRVYYKENSCVFKKNNEEFGALSNMATGFPLQINGITIKTTEALYQACRFPHIPDIQKKIIEEKSPMVVKMISSANKKKSRQDWDTVRLKVMKWCLQLKLAQNFVSFGVSLHETGLKNIVENSSKDNFWGAIPNEDRTIYTGKNALGRLLMDLRQAFYSKDSFSLLYVEKPQIENFFLLNELIGVIDERENFVNWLQNYLKISDVNSIIKSKLLKKDFHEGISYYSDVNKINVKEEGQTFGKGSKVQQKVNGKKKKKTIVQADFFSST